ncbi:MAG TPA: OadG family protein [Tichowtungia sp.]|nr:OadG family protein [Tichowtungia sp.]
MGQGLVLLIVGMATVFAFLVLLVIAMQTSAAFFKKYAHLFPEEAPQTSAPAADPSAAIAAALAAIRAKRG